ncbi:MAG: sigma 54-interacting transcriptional regulator [Polyangiaceae bacterium]|nr:sigma 54-interacting transcriptional regulator [Polyangiaceae bacterium]
MDDVTEVQTALRASTHEAPALSLVVVDGPDVGKRAPAAGTVRIGTAPGNDIVLADPTVSRLHATLSPDGQAARLRDMGSTNGTFVDGVRVRDASVIGGSLIRLGGTTLRVEQALEPVRIELAPYDRLGELVGGSPAMRQVYALIERVAPTNSTVLIQGETGTGKELVARAIHERSERRGGRFLAIDCGAIPENLVESELFGHIKGSFSGATSDRVGAFEETDGGTLFFDEVGELTAPMQRKLLRALETREIRRVGENRERKVDVRVIAATHRPLARAANEGRFREDLYFRLAVVTIELPPLRARREDIPLIAQHFLDRLTGGTERVGPDLAAALLGRSWNGNVRELRNFLERRVALAATTQAPPSPASSGASNEPWVRFDLPFKEAQARLLEQFELAYLKTLLQRVQGNVTRAAQLGGISRRFLQRRMIELGLREATGEEAEEP